MYGKEREEFERWKKFAAGSKNQSQIWDEDIAEELEKIDGNHAEIFDRFYRDLEFGTGGLRGVIGAGTNRMNVYVVAKASKGLADYLNKKEKKPSVAIAYDSRIKSDVFARTAAGVLAANGIKVYIYPQLMPTPSLSFAVRYLKCSAGICVTASHNPAEYNGYKVYGADGCQITLEEAARILDEINKLDIFEDVINRETEKKEDDTLLIEEISPEVTDAFIQAVKKESLTPVRSDMHVVYTPLNGAGLMCVTRILNEIGIKRLTLVEEQKEPDGHFPTCPYPNPEKKEALQKGILWCEKTGADLLLATDPDCDRVGVAVRSSGEYRLLTGNEMGILLFDYIASRRKALGTMPSNPVAVKTIVTTDMAEKVADYYQVSLINVLTGFKFIGEQIGILEKKGEEQRYIFGFEESYGYLSGSYVRDKDAVDGSMLICEMASYYKEQGKTLWNRMEEIYEQFGYYQNELLDFSFKGAAGMKEMKELMSGLREKEMKAIGGVRIIAFVDYLASVKKCKEEISTVLLPKSDVLEYRLEDGGKVVIRPSGTEPKIKLYLTACADSREKVRERMEQMKQAVGKIVNG